MSEIVSVDPHLMHGTPCFRGTRVPVRILLDDLKTGFTIDDFLAGCPTVTREQVERYLELARAANRTTCSSPKYKAGLTLSRQSIGVSSTNTI
ncbi:MAG: DUF433 domain-containing protein [Bryobacteraceae bacterium]